MPKFTFNAASSESCVPFIYGGCGGSENLFDSEAECTAKCVGPKDEDDFAVVVEAVPRTLDVCALPIAKGNCRGMKIRCGLGEDSTYFLNPHAAYIFCYSVSLLVLYRDGVW